MDKKQKTIFAIRLTAFLLFGLIGPVCFIMWRYGIFTGEWTEGSLWGFWTILAAIVLFICARYVLRELTSIFPSSRAVGIFNGLAKVVLPLILVYAALNSLQDTLEQLTQSVLACIGFEAVAVCVNPFPEWVGEHQREKEGRSFAEFAKTFVAEWRKGE